ncbi:hypothetical protein D1007_53013 [Hordeum vulgare]|nr:hypothetical protein D1007_53013 [Hordeum vulgare]
MGPTRALYRLPLVPLPFAGRRPRPDTWQIVFLPSVSPLPSALCQLMAKSFFGMSQQTTKTWLTAKNWIPVVILCEVHFHLRRAGAAPRSLIVSPPSPLVGFDQSNPGLLPRKNRGGALAFLVGEFVSTLK